MRHLLHEESVNLGHSKILTTGSRLLNSAVCSGRGIGIGGASILGAGKVVNHLGIELFDGLRLRTVRATGTTTAATAGATAPSGVGGLGGRGRLGLGFDLTGPN
ncbi:hypothetical protein GB937_006704 [Aspergillus fischeri]|nr:hypothetical protein GB937_006704 [Aspergillus fischeri]